MSKYRVVLYRLYGEEYQDVVAGSPEEAAEQAELKADKYAMYDRWSTEDFARATVWLQDESGDDQDDDGVDLDWSYAGGFRLCKEDKP